MLEAVIALVLIIAGCTTKDSSYFVAAGLFALAANVSEMNRKE